MRKRNFSEWVIVVLIVLFFAIPVCGMAVTHSDSFWPQCPESFLYNLGFK